MDVVTFLGPKVPVEVKKLLGLLQKLKPEVFDTLLKFVEHFIKTQPLSTPLSEENFTKVQQMLHLDQITISNIFTGLYVIVRGAVRSRVKLDVLEKDLQELRFPQHLITSVTKLIKNNQQAFEDVLIERRMRYSTVTDLRWRVDVAISTNSMSRVMKPSILVEMVTSDGKRRVFEMSVEKFHELRYNVAKTLQQISDLEKAAILKINK